LWQDDIDEFEAIHAARPHRNVRVYSSEGFVPNSYKWRCEIEYIEFVNCYPDGKIIRGWTSAQRSYGQQSLVIIR